MSVSAGSVWRPTVGRSGLVVVRVIQTSAAIVEPWPPRARRRLRRSTIPLTSDKSALQGYVSTGQRG